jgi:hypothetical protein
MAADQFADHDRREFLRMAVNSMVGTRLYAMTADVPAERDR